MILVTYQLRDRTGLGGDGPARVMATMAPAEDPAAWVQACKLAEQNSWDVYQQFPAGDSAYIVSYCGGGPYWWKPGTAGGGMHQIGSAGFCWECLRPDPDSDRPQLGLILHPTTPHLVAVGAPDYQCFICCAQPGEEHLPVEHLVIWGEENHPRCEQCGLAYQTATPEGIGYAEHDPSCPWVTRIGLDAIIDAQLDQKDQERRARGW